MAWLFGVFSSQKNIFLLWCCRTYCPYWGRWHNNHNNNIDKNTILNSSISLGPRRGQKTRIYYNWCQNGLSHYPNDISEERVSYSIFKICMLVVSYTWYVNLTDLYLALPLQPVQHHYPTGYLPWSGMDSDSWTHAYHIVGIIQGFVLCMWSNMCWKHVWPSLLWRRNSLCIVGWNPGSPR